MRRLAPPSEKATWMDAYRLGLGFLMIARTVGNGIVTPLAVLMGLLFVGFGTYRLYVGLVRYRIYCERALQHRGSSRTGPDCSPCHPRRPGFPTPQPVTQRRAVPENRPAENRPPTRNKEAQQIGCRDVDDPLATTHHTRWQHARLAERAASNSH